MSNCFNPHVIVIWGLRSGIRIPIQLSNMSGCRPELLACSANRIFHSLELGAYKA